MAKLYSNFGSPNYNYRKVLRNNELIPVRVVDTIMDETHPEYNIYGGPNSIGAIKYTFLDRTVNTNDTTTLNIAYPASSTIRTLPLKNEIVFIIQGPDSDITEVKGTSAFTYYVSIISVWNHPTHNKAPKEGDNSPPDDRYGFPNIEDVNPLQPFPGDVLMEGRLGQSIRLGGAKFTSNILTDSSNNGQPFIILSNGQKDVGNGSQHIIEDVNEDASSIYLTSNHKVPILQVKDKYESIKSKPVLADKYKGSQIIINSGRLFFNAKEESIGFASKKSFTITTEVIGLDAETELGLDAKKIHLGSNALRELEPVPKGDTLANILDRIVQVLDQIGTGFANSFIPSPGGPDIGLTGQAATIKQLTSGIKSDIKTIKSKKVFTE